MCYGHAYLEGALVPLGLAAPWQQHGISRDICITVTRYSNRHEPISFCYHPYDLTEAYQQYQIMEIVY